MKRLLFLSICLLLLLNISACKRHITESATLLVEDSQFSLSEEITIAEMNTEMKLYINEVEIPVTWEENPSVDALKEELKDGDIVVSMSMYGGNEQVGSLGKHYPSNDVRTTTNNGDIVLYNSNQIVVFYGSNSWAYTRLGKMNLSAEKVIELLSNGDVSIRLAL